MSDASFDQLQAAFARGGASALLDQLVQQLRDDRRYHELFDALLLQARHRLGLPAIITAPLDDLPEPKRTQVEEVYLAACREVGLLLLHAGQLRAAWMYLRPLADKQLLAAELAQIEPDEDNLEDLIEIALHEGMAPALGYRLVLENHGTCNAISTFDAALAGRPAADRRAAAGLLVEHLYRELVASVREDIRRQEGSEPRETNLVALLADRDWLFLNNNYHVDTTHLAATVRIARLVDDPAILKLALELTEYGRQLASQFQFAGEEPFQDVYPMHARYFRAVLGQDVEPTLELFREKAEAAAAAEEGTQAAEAYVELLARLGRYSQAADEAARLLPGKIRGSAAVPSLMELSQQAGSYERLLESARSKDDPVSYTAGLLARAAGAPASK